MDAGRRSGRRPRGWRRTSSRRWSGARRRQPPTATALDVLDCATRVEAFVALGRFRRMPGARWTCTWRTRHGRVRSVLDVPAVRRGAAAGRTIRRGALWWSACGRRSSAIGPAARRWRTPDGRAAKPRVSVRRCCCGSRIPAWNPGGVPDLSIQARMGTVLSITGSEATVRALMKDPHRGRRRGQPAGRRSWSASARCPSSRCRTSTTGRAGTFSEKGDGALVAIIDDGIDVLHGAFLDADGPVAHRRHLGSAGQGGTAAEGFDFGTFYSQEQIQQWVADNPGPERGDVHGAGGVVAEQGRPRHARREHRGRPCRRQVRRRRGAGGEASSSSSARAANTIGYSNAHLAALKFIDRFARRQEMPVVVNLSQGHERRRARRAIGARDRVRRVRRAAAACPGRIVVKSAGNERGKRGHAKVDTAAGQRGDPDLAVADRSRPGTAIGSSCGGTRSTPCDSG